MANPGIIGATSIGCAYGKVPMASTPNRWRYIGAATVCADTVTNLRRACACDN
jgi:hypothetical protein